jgi:ubiquinone/menaquinone biosynthesis C-methylase UbiE
MSDQPIDFEKVRREQREFWNSSAPSWRRMFVALDRAAQHASDRLVALARIKPGDRVLDIATGSGEPAITAARKCGPTGSVVASDVAPQMLALARERAAALGVTNIRFVESGVESLDVGETGFNAIVCRWGLMFAPDLNAAARRIASLLAPGAWFATAVWGTPDKVPMISVGDEIVRRLANLPAPAKDAPHPLRLADTAPLEAALRSAGFKDLSRETINVAFDWDSPEAFTEMRRAGSSIFNAMLERQPEELRKKILDAVTVDARRFTRADGKVHMDNEAILIAGHI